MATVFIGVKYKNGAVRQYTAQDPLGFVIAVEEGRNTAGLPRGMTSASRREPRVGLFFEGNPAAGGVEVHAEGAPP